MILNISINHSNPQIIRKIYINEEMPIYYLVRAIEECLGMSKGKILFFMEKDYLQKSCSSLFLRDVSEALRLEIPMEKVNNYWDYEEPENWFILIERENENDYEIISPDQDIFLFFASAFHPVWRSTSIKENNKYLHDMLETGHAYIQRYGSQNMQSYKVNKARINKKLFEECNSFRDNQERNANQHMDAKSICYNNTDDLKAILNSHRVQELKDIVREEELAVNAYLRKGELIYSLIDYYDRETFWERLLQEFHLSEYNSFQKICRGDCYDPVKSEDNMMTLRRFCLSKERAYNYPLIPRQLVNYYEKRIRTQGDDDLIFSKKMKTVMSVACCLYGVFDKMRCRKLAEVMYPEEWNDMDFKGVWKSSQEWEQLNIFYMYDIMHLPRNYAYRLMEKNSNTQNDYIPSKEEAYQILNEGLHFEDEDVKKLYDLLLELRMYYRRENNYLWAIQSIYDHCRMNASWIDIWRDLQYHFGFHGEKAKQDNLKKYVDMCRPKVRAYEYQGYTAEEYL